MSSSAHAVAAYRSITTSLATYCCRRRALVVAPVLIVAVFVAMTAATAAAADQPTPATPTEATPKKEAPDAIKQSLTQPILGKGDVVAALSRWCSDRLPEQPKATSGDDWRAQAKELRRRALDEVIFRGRAQQWRNAPLRVEWKETIPGGPGYTIRKLRYEAVPGMWIPALVYMPEGISGKVPAVLNFHGHCHHDGKSYTPKQIRCINLAKRGMIAMSPGWLWTGQLKHPDFSHERASLLDLCGASGMAPFYLLMSRAMDILSTMDQVDASRIAVTGLSGGGWQTIVFCPLDERAALVAPNAGYASLAVRIDHRESLGDYEQTPCDLGAFCDYSHLTAMIAPRPLVMIYNIRDNCCFRGDSTLAPLVGAALPIYRLFDKPRYCQWHVNFDPGTHNYERDNREALYRAINEFFLSGDQRVDATEIPSDGEVKTMQQLWVDLPKDNATFQSIAKRLIADRPKPATPPTDAAARARWAKERREALRKVIRYADMPAQAELVDESTPDGSPAATVRRWRLALGRYWTAPAVEFVPKGEPTETVVLMNDAGRAACQQRVAELLGSGKRVLVVDPLLIGGQCPQRRFDRDRLALLVQSMGGRVIGVSAGQVASVARWAKQQYEQPVRLETWGRRTSLSALVAKALDPSLAAGLEMRGSLKSLTQVVDGNWEFGDMPEATCFGLLDTADIDQLRLLAE